MQKDSQSEEHSIQLLRVLLVMSPDDAASRFELLSLLFKKGDAEEFLQEARKFKRNHPDEHRSWGRICAMGRELAPFDLAFSTSEAEPPARSSGLPPSDLVDFVEASASPGEPEVDRRHRDRRRQERRSGFDRRSNPDRRTAQILWLGEQRRRGERRQQARRESDIAIIHPA